MAKMFSKTEKCILALCKNKTTFLYNNDEYKIIKSGKPKPFNKGECKTDVYILAKNLKNNEEKEFKISIKQSNAHFLENKITLERALQILGENAKEIIQKSINNVKSFFEKENLIAFEKKGHTQAKSIKIGWRFELFLEKQGDKSALMELTQAQKIDVFAGTNLSDDKKNSKVNGEIIKNSGVANFILLIDDTNISDDLNLYMNHLRPIEQYASITNIYFGCKAINYRANKDGKIKWEGDRSLSVFVDWALSENKLKGTLVYNKPLELTAHQVGKNLSQILYELKIDKDNFEDLKSFFTIK